MANIAQKLADTVGLTSPDRVVEIGHACERTAIAVMRGVDQLRRTPITAAQHWGIDKITVPIPFDAATRVLADADRILRADPDAEFVMHNDAWRLDAVAGSLREALATAEPFRRHAKS